MLSYICMCVSVENKHDYFLLVDEDKTSITIVFINSGLGVLVHQI